MQLNVMPRTICKMRSNSKQWVTAVEDSECKPQVWEERWPRVQGIVKIHFTGGLTAMSIAPQIWVLTIHDRLGIYIRLFIHTIGVNEMRVNE